MGVWREGERRDGKRGRVGEGKGEGRGEGGREEGRGKSREKKDILIDHYICKLDRTRW